MPALLHWKLLPTLSTGTFSEGFIALPGASASVQGTYPWGTVFLGVYAVVSVALLLRLGTGIGRMWRIRRTSPKVSELWTCGLDIRIAGRLSSPVTFGSTILVPVDHTFWTELERSIILEHERAHVRHYDSQLQWLATLHICVFWFSPLAWWLRRRLAELAELASDDAVLEGNTSAADYASALLEVARARHGSWIAVSMSSGSLAKRIERILSVERTARAASARPRRVLAMLAVMPAIGLVAETSASNVGGLRGNDSEAMPLGMSRAYPYITAVPAREDLAREYPALAVQSGLDGLVRITVVVDESGRPIRAAIVAETPDGVGFGKAAQELAKKFTYVNPTGHAAAVTYKIKFELKRAAHPAGRHS
jgi:TonB family protein